MGDTFYGSDARQTGSVDLMTPQQQSFLNSILGTTQPQTGQALQSLLGEFDPNQLNDFYQKGLVNPTIRTYNEQVLPAIQQRFGDLNAGSSSALNQALAQSATNISQGLSGQLSGLLYQGQQQGNANQLSALSQILSLLGQRNFSPIIQSPTQGLIGPLIGAGGSALAASIPYLSAAALSTEEAKENISPYDKGLDVIRELKVKTYDYKPEFFEEEDPNLKNRVGLIAEEIPQELTLKMEQGKGVDLYGLIGVLINAVKTLDQKVASLGG